MAAKLTFAQGAAFGKSGSVLPLDRLQQFGASHLLEYCERPTGDIQRASRRRAADRQTCYSSIVPHLKWWG
jgi:hypothetical protein